MEVLWGLEKPPVPLGNECAYSQPSLAHLMSELGRVPHSLVSSGQYHLTSGVLCMVYLGQSLHVG